MTNININYKNSTIEITKAFEQKARQYGSEAYRELREVRKEFPDYSISIKKTKANKIFEGMDFKFMLNYIENHENADERIAAFNKLCENKVTYGEVKKWFIETYPIFQHCKTRTEWVLAE